MPPNSGEKTLPDCISRIVGIGSGDSLTLGRRVGSQKDLAHQHDNVGLAAMGCAGRHRLRRNLVDGIGHVACRRRDVGHRQVERKRHGKAVVTVVFRLVPHDRDDLQTVAHPGKIVVVHQMIEGTQKRQGDGEPRQALAPAKVGEAAPGKTDKPRKRNDGDNQANGDAGSRPRAVFDQNRHQFHDLAAEQEVCRVKRVGEENLLLPADERRHERQRREQDHAEIFACEEGVEREEKQKEHAGGGPCRARGVEEEKRCFRCGIAGNPFDAENQCDRQEQRQREMPCDR